MSRASHPGDQPRWLVPVPDLDEDGEAVDEVGREVRPEVRGDVPESAAEEELSRELAVPEETAVAEPVEDALVRWEEPAAPPVVRPVIVVVRVVQTVARDDRTRTAAKTAVREVLFVVTGAGVVMKRLWEAKTNSRYERMMRIAEASGNFELVAEWEQRAELARERRHRRRMAVIEAPVNAAKSAGTAAGLGTGFLLVVGISMAVADHDAHEVMEPLRTAAGLIRDVVTVVTVVWGPLVLAAPWLGLVMLWQIGRRHGTAPAWLATPDADGAEIGAVVTADTIVLALQHLRIPEIKKAMKDGWIPAFHQPPVRDGRGYWAVVGLPLGVTAEMVADQRSVLARNLHRAEVETWPSDAEKAGTGPAGFLDLWIADRGAISKAAPEYPLLHEGIADVFEGVPGGVSPRGDALTIPIVANNWVTGGMMGQGKSNACRVVMLGCALDPLAELCVFVFAGNGDFDAYAPRLSKYERGATDEVTAAGLAHLHWLYGEVGRREQRLAELGAKKVTRALAEKHPDLRPIISLFSECHELFGHKEYGEEAADVAVQVLRRARKTAIVCGFDTQSSRKDAIPPKIVELVSVNACFAVKSWRSNDGFLGDGSFAAGIRATELRPTTDRGTSLITGISDASFELLRWYFIEVDDDTGYDAAADVIARAVADMASGTRGGGNALQVEAPAERDLLEDLAEVLGEEPVPVADVPALLRDHAPGWAPYRSMTGKALRTLLADEYGVKVPSTGNRWPLDPEAVRAALARQREEES